MATQALQPASQGGAVAAPRPKRDIQDLLKSDQFKKAVTAALPKHMTPDRFIRVALTAVMRTPELLKCSQESLFQCMLDLSALGLEADGRRAHLIPYGNKCTLIVDYKGLVELAYRSGNISKIHADKVCENDVFVFDRGEIKTHEIDFKKPRGDAYAYYSLVVFKDGTESSQVMTLDEIAEVRKRSRAAKNGPWVTDPGEMSKKTVFKRHSKWIPLASEFHDAIRRDDENESLEPRHQREVASIDISSFAPSADENRGHDHTNDAMPEADDEGVQAASGLDPEETISEERADELKAAMDAADWTVKERTALWQELKVEGGIYKLTNAQCDLAFAEVAAKAKK